MASMTDFLEDALRDHVFRNIPYTSPPELFFGIFTSATTDAGGGDEAVGGGYVRQLVAFDAGAAGTGAADNPDPITFSNLPEGTFTHGALFDDELAGNMLVHAPLNAPKTVNAGDSITFEPGDVDAIFA